MAHVFNPSIREAEVDWSLWVQDQPALKSEFQERLQSYTEKFCLKKRKKEIPFANL